MDLNLGKRHVVVTGGSRGIGRACVHAFLAEGARVSVISRRSASVQAAVDALKAGGHDCFGWAADLSDADAAVDAIDRAEAAAGPIDILVNSAGAAQKTPFAELTPRDWRVAMDAKFFACVFTTAEVARRMGSRHGGTIVNVIGMGGKVARTTHLPGGAANAALMLATAGLAAAWGPRGVRINGINPGATQTDRLQDLMSVQARADGISLEDVLRREAASVPLGRFATPEEIANAVVFLASPRASYVSGAMLSMDGAAVPIVV